MAQFVGTSITIEGKSIKQFSSLSISQVIFGHHSFQLVCPSEAIDGTSGSIFNKSKDIIGGNISIQIDSINSTGTFQFTGVITQVEASRHSGHAGDLMITGFSPTILLDNGPHCKTWEKKAVKNIAQDVVSHFPQNLLQPKISPSYGETLSYMVQYRETAWQFLNRLSANFGEWLFYDGQKLILGSPQGSKTKLNFGSNLVEFSMALQVQPAAFKMMAYDYMNHEVYDGSPANIPNKAGLNDFGKHVFQKSEKFFATKPKQWHNQFLTNKKQLDDYMNTRASMQSSNMVRFKGQSGHPGVQVGGMVSVEGKNVFSGSDESFGDYNVISVEHICDGQGNYTNHFVAVPSSVKMPPVLGADEPRCETQSALVTDNHDPKGLGRIRVKFHWMSGSEKSPWLRMTSMHGGDGKGMFFIPEVGEEVIVGFEGDSATKPYVIGTVFHSKAKTDFSNKDNDVKAIQTRSGNKILLNDKGGSIQIVDSKGNVIFLDGEGNIEIKSSKKITIKSKDISLSADSSISLNASSINIHASQDLKMEGTSKGVIVKGQKMEIEALTSLEISGITTKVSGKAQLELESSALAKVKATIVQIN